MLTPQQKTLLDFIRARLKQTGVTPSYEEMQDALGLKSKSGVHRLITSLAERGYIRRMPRRARALEVVGGNRHVHTLPLYGRIAAGQPIEAQAETETIAVPAALLGGVKANAADHYALTVHGDSMVEAGILDRDVALIRADTNAHNGAIVVALVRDQDATLKYFSRKGGQVTLKPANAAHKPQVYPAADVRVQGVLVGLVRRY